MLLLLFGLFGPFGLITITTTEQLFDEFVTKFNRTYNKNSLEFSKRLDVFKESLERIEHLNSHKNHEDSAIYGITEYSDLTTKEFINAVIKRRPDPKGVHKIVKRAVEPVDFKNISGIPQKIDWREKNIISSINNQDKCGACWAFSTVQTIESMSALKTKNLTKLSVQQMVDCSTTNNGCDGGDTCEALEWLIENDVPLTSEKDYPFQDSQEGESGPCLKTPKVGVQIAGYTCDNFTGNEVEILKLLANRGPVVAAVDASSWQDYLGGIIQFHCDTNRNHAVQIVGYDLTGDIPYYIVRNSWGERFGLKGYLHVAIGKNLCAISEEVSSVTMK